MLKVRPASSQDNLVRSDESWRVVYDHNNRAGSNEGDVRRVRASFDGPTSCGSPQDDEDRAACVQARATSRRKERGKQKCCGECSSHNRSGYDDPYNKKFAQQ